MPHILSVGTAVPAHQVSQKRSMEFSRQMFRPAISNIDRYLKVFETSGIRKRHFAVPLDWFAQEHSFAEKNRTFVECASHLGCEAVERCLQQAGYTPADIDCLVFNTSTGFSTPSIDALILNRLHMRQDLTRIPLWGLGCAGGAMGLSRAYEYAKAYPESLVLLLSLELCGLTFIKQDMSKSNLVATSLFADGAGAVLIAGDNRAQAGTTAATPAILGSKTQTWPDSLDIMGWDVTDDGLQVIFSQDIPTLVKQRVRDIVDDFLACYRLSLSDIQHFIFHPGGPKVITAYQEALELAPEKMRFSAEVLRDYGNMSSATVLHVLAKSMAATWADGEYGLLGALGPGFSSELVLLRKGE